MAYRDDQFDDDEADLDEREGPDESDVDDDEASDTLPCPFCGRPVYEGADVCPHCRNFVSFDAAPGRKRSWVYVVVGALLLAALACVVRYV